jgi:hypothetical protein
VSEPIIEATQQPISETEIGSTATDPSRGRGRARGGSRRTTRPGTPTREPSARVEQPVVAQAAGDHGAIGTVRGFGNDVPAFMLIARRPGPRPDFSVTSTEDASEDDGRPNDEGTEIAA